MIQPAAEPDERSVWHGGISWMRNAARTRTPYDFPQDRRHPVALALGRQQEHGSAAAGLGGGEGLYLTATLDAATWGAELGVGEGPGRICRVEPAGRIEDDPNLTDKKFPGNPTRSYRTRQPLRVAGEILGWEPHPPGVLQAMRNHLDELKRLGVEAIND